MEDRWFRTFEKLSFTIALPFISVLIVACSGGGPTSGTAGDAGPGTGGVSGTGGSAGGSGSASAGGTGGSSACPNGCDDGLPCTLDSCGPDGCTHTIGPDSGATACAVGKYCTLDKGCVASPVCATDQDCIDAWKGDPCKANPRCDAASSVCTFDVLDKDGDGYPPQACGGADCDDSDPDIHPGASEVCDGIDNDCDGIVDGQNALCSVMKGSVCVNGSCVCPQGQTQCDNRDPVYPVCSDVKSDPRHCGGCSHDCSSQQTCQNGVCT